jgi:hypothetical protein
MGGKSGGTADLVIRPELIFSNQFRIFLCGRSQGGEL